MLLKKKSKLKQIGLDHSAENGTTTLLQTFTLIWILGVIFLDKTFAYISFGPFYITETLLVSLIAAEWSRLRTADIFFMGSICTYIAVGILLGRDIFFVIKDISWLYYLLFLRFFPKEFPKKYIRIVVWACVIRLGIIYMYPTFQMLEDDTRSVMGMLMSKYRDGIVIVFLLCYATLKTERKSPGITMVIILGIASFITDYKTLILAVIAFPMVLKFGGFVGRWYSTRRILMMATILGVIIYTKQVEAIMIAAVDTLNMITFLTGMDTKFTTGTAIWRTEIWTRALAKLVTPTDLLFGEFPGHNYIDSKFLGIKMFSLQGADSLGNLRSAHNILVQMLMKTGVIGVILFCWYYFKQAKTSLMPLRISQLTIIALGLTADILEVPSRGPLAYCLFIILKQKFEPAIAPNVAITTKILSNVNDEKKYLLQKREDIYVQT